MEPTWTAEEQALVEASAAYYAASIACEAAGGRTQEAIEAGMPDDVREAIRQAAPMLGALGLG